VSNALDQKATEIARNWSAGMDSRFKSGVDVTIGVEYNLVRALLSEYFGLFDGAQQ
jgi:hypothetical protein